MIYLGTLFSTACNVLFTLTFVILLYLKLNSYINYLYSLASFSLTYYTH